MKNIYNIAENLSLVGGGQRTAVTNLHSYINSDQTNLNSIIVTNQKEPTDDFIEFAPKKDSFWSYSKALKEYLETNISSESIIHLHGAWMYTQYIGSKIAKQKNAPYLITLHGMIQPWYLEQKKLKKKIYLDLILRNILKDSKIIHAITPYEKDNIFKLSKHKNIVEIPNFINYSEIPKIEEYNPEEEYLLFLSRLHEGKGLEILIQAMEKIDNKKIKLKIAGPENEYSNGLKKIIQDSKLSDRISIVGSVFGKAKYELFANAKAFILPSYSEAIGMVNLEAACCKTPVITTFNTGIKPDWNVNGGVLINPNIEELVKAMNDAISWSIEERNHRGKTLSDFVTENYSWEQKGHLWTELYNTI